MVDRSSPVSETLRDTFEAWASSDNRAIQPLEFEKRTDDNNHYYESDYDNNAFIGWKAARTGHAQTPAEASNLIDARLADLREANEIFRKSSWNRESDIHRNDREIRWLIDLRTVLLADHAQRPLTAEDVYANCETTLIGFRDELTERDIKFICDQVSRKVILALSSTDRAPLNQKTRCEECNLMTACGDPKCPNAGATSVSSPERK